MNSEHEHPPEQAHPLGYRRLAPTSMSWVVVQSFTSLGHWHQAKAVLERGGVPTRMDQNPMEEDAVDLLVPGTDVLWAAELLRRSRIVKEPIERAKGFPMVSHAPPPPDAPRPTVMPAPPDATGTTPVLKLDYSEPPAPPMANYGCALVVLWTALAIVVLLTVLVLMMN